MNIKKFSIIGYFIKNYFNWSKNYSELEGCVEDFLAGEKEETVEAFKKEAEALYLRNDPDLIREVSYRLGDRGMPAKKAINMVKLLYIKTQGEAK